jgi:two-component system phosphate regulon response regulator PhoB
MSPWSNRAGLAAGWEWGMSNSIKSRKYVTLSIAIDINDIYDRVLKSSQRLGKKAEMKKILIVEDHADIRRLIRMTLELDDYDIAEASDGESGFATALHMQPDLVLLDVMMPGMLNGLDVCRALKGQSNPPKVLLLTARGRSEDLAAGYEAGAEAYLVKPFSPLQLIENINQLLEAA